MSDDTRLPYEPPTLTEISSAVVEMIREVERKRIVDVLREYAQQRYDAARVPPYPGIRSNAVMMAAKVIEDGPCDEYVGWTFDCHLCRRCGHSPARHNTKGAL